MAPPAKKPRGPSAYMIFTHERRQEVQERLKQESENGKVAAPAIAKALGEVWKGMREEEKDVYRQKSKERAEAAAAAAEEAAAAAGDQEQQEGDTAAAGEDATPQAAAAAIPKHIVKRIMLADDEVQRVSADALWLVGEAGRLFLQQLAVKGAAAAASKKRKTIKLEDFEHVVRSDKRLVAVGLKDVVNNRSLYDLHGIAAALGGAAGRKQRSTPAAAAAKGDVADPQQQLDAAEPGTAGDAATAAAADGDDEQQQQQEEEEEQQLTDEERIALEEAKRKKAAEAAKARAAKAAERKVAEAAELAKDTHKITTFFVSNKPDTFV